MTLSVILESFSSSSSISMARKALILLSKGIHDGVFTKDMLFEIGFVERAIAISGKFRSPFLSSLILKIFTWLCQSDQPSKEKLHCHGGVKYVLSILQESQDKFFHAKRCEIEALEESALRLLAELSCSSPQLQADFWSLGMLSTCYDILSSVVDGRSTDYCCCYLHRDEYKKTAAALQENFDQKELVGKFVRCSDSRNIGVRIPPSLEIDVYESQLFRSSNGKFTSISHDLEKFGLTWAPEGPSSLQIGCDSEDVKDRDLDTTTGNVLKLNFSITAFLSSNVVAGYIQPDLKNREVKKISQALGEEALSAVPVKSLLGIKRGDFVFFPVMVEEVLWRRGFVLEASHDYANVFSIDTGETIMVSCDMLYLLPSYMKDKKPQACICVIKGLRRLPRSRKAVIHATRVLRNFCCGGHYVKVDLMSTKVVEIIVKLARIPWKEVVTNVIGAAEALGTNLVFKEELGSYSILPILQDIILRDSKLLQSTLSCLINLLVEGIKNRHLSAKMNLLSVLLIALRNSKDPDVKELCRKVIKNLIGNQWNLLHPSDLRSVQEMSTKGHHSIRLNRPTTELSQRRSLSEFTSQPVYKALTVDDVVGALALTSDPDEERQSLSEEYSDLKECSEDMTTPDFDVLTSENTQGVQAPVEAFTYQDFLSVVPGSCYEFRPEESLQNASRESLGQSICAILNSGRQGFIVFGVEENCRIFGVNIPRTQRDRFRLNLDNLKQRLAGATRETKVQVQFIPVLERLKAKGSVAKQMQERFVTIVSVAANKDFLYKWRGTYYLREGNTNVVLTIEKLRQNVLARDCKKYKDEIHRLQMLISVRERMQSID